MCHGIAASLQMPANLEDFSKVDLKDLDDWLTMAEHYGFYIIIRPGPYICAEWATGGFPEWLLTKKPEQPLRSEGWLRSDDPVFLAWSKHWYDAVCPVIARHQITRKAPGQPGVILVQVENEYDYCESELGPHFSDQAKINCLKALAVDALTDGIDVPLFACCTHQVRGSSDPVLRQIFDCFNLYPLWDVDGTRKYIQNLRREQPDAPLATAELQGGQFSEIGGKLSEDQDGLTASQINNLTLFTIQNGETMLNYYMVFGGSNLGDWAARGFTTTYDYNAPIREEGGVGDRYQRVWAIGHMLREHGIRLARAVAVDSYVTTSQKDVTVVMRRAPDGSRYVFVRTSQHTEPRAGTATVREKSGGTNDIVFHYQLEPFGAKILYLPPGVKNATQSEWLPKPVPAIERPTDLPAPVSITSAKCQVDPGPLQWTKLNPGENLAQAGIYDSRFVFYRTKIDNRTPTKLMVKYPAGDAVLATANREPAVRVGGKVDSSIVALPAGSVTVQLLYENRGFAKHGKDMEQPAGIIAARLAHAAVPLESFGSPAGIEQEWWKPDFADGLWKTVAIGPSSPQLGDLLTWYRMNFQLPSLRPDVWDPWHLHLEATGNGFLYLNGHAIGRYWDAGPQHDFYLPECWLNFGNGRTNNLTLSLRPTGQGVAIQSASVEPYAGVAQ